MMGQIKQQINCQGRRAKGQIEFNSGAIQQREVNNNPMIDYSQLEEFKTHRGVAGAAKQVLPLSQVLKKCEEQVLQSDMINSIVNLINRIITRNFQQSDAHIFPISIRPNQAEHLPFYLHLLENTLQTFLSTLYIEPKGKSKSDKQAQDDLDKQQQKKSNCQFYFGLKEERIFSKHISGTDVRDITLDIYSDSEDLDGKPPFILYIYYITRVTDLSQENMYVFSKGVNNKKFIAFVPTQETFEDDSLETASNLRYQKYITFIYNSKSLFCEYFLECIRNPEIKAYLPPEAYRLITDIDFYSLSYSESCRRLNYCILRAQQLNQSARPQVEDYSPFVKAIEETFTKVIGHIQPILDRQRIIKIILKEDQRFIISSKMIESELELGSRNPQLKNYDQEALIFRLRHSIEKRLNPPYNKYLSNEQTSSELPKTRRKTKLDDRIQTLGLSSGKILTPKMILENQITRIFKDMTKECRKFAASLKWSDFHFSERISPCIPLQIVNSMRQDEQTEDIVKQVTSKIYNPISNLLNLFPEECIGQGLYLIKTVELSGLFTISKRQINPLVYNCYFEKGRF